MNWYTVFYLITVADALKEFFDTTSTILTIFSAILLAGYVLMRGLYASELASYGDETNDAKAVKVWVDGTKWLLPPTFVLCLLTWAAYVAVPTKRDALIIVAGGAVGEFIASDSSAKAIPAEAMALLRGKITAEIGSLELQQLTQQAAVDTLKAKSREELIEMIQNQKN